MEVEHIAIDTMSYAFTFHIISMFTGVNIGAYVQYPTIGTETPTGSSLV